MDHKHKGARRAMETRHSQLKLNRSTRKMRKTRRTRRPRKKDKTETSRRTRAARRTIMPRKTKDNKGKDGQKAKSEE